MPTQEEESQASEAALLNKELEQPKEELEQPKPGSAYAIARWMKVLYSKHRSLQWFWRFAARITRRLKQKLKSIVVRRRLERSPLFDAAYYAQKYAGHIDNHEDLIADFMASYPAELRDPSVHFSSVYYLNHYPDVRQVGVHPLVHYLVAGQREGRTELSNMPIDVRRRLECSPLFDAAFYTQKYAGHINNHEDLIADLAASYPAELRDPSVLFSSAYYLNHYPDVRQAGVHPLVHYLVDGQREGRTELSNIPIDMRRRLERSPLFDAAYYAQKYAGHINNHEDLIADFVTSYPAELRDPSVLFSSVYYLNQYPDVRQAGVHPLVHYLVDGQHEGRAALVPHRVNSFWERLDTPALTLRDLIPIKQKIKLHCFEKGNFFFADISQYCHIYLTHLGYSVDESDPSAVDVVIAPHEFMVYGAGKKWSVERVENAIYLNTEQWQTGWFSYALQFMQKSKLGCLDINPTSAAGLVKLGIRCAFLPILPLPNSCFEQTRLPATASLTARRFIRPLEYPKVFENRIYDVLLVAVSNPRRERIIAGLAPALSQFNTFVHCPKFSGPIERGDPDAICSSDFTQLALNSKILLNIHRDEIPYFEWHRIFLYGVMNGCVVVTEPCYPSAYVTAGEHYIEATPGAMPEVLLRLLTTSAGCTELARVHANVNRLREEIRAKEYQWA